MCMLKGSERPSPRAPNRMPSLNPIFCNIWKPLLLGDKAVDKPLLLDSSWRTLKGLEEKVNQSDSTTACVYGWVLVRVSVYSQWCECVLSAASALPVCSVCNASGNCCAACNFLECSSLSLPSLSKWDVLVHHNSYRAIKTVQALTSYASCPCEAESAFDTHNYPVE